MYCITFILCIMLGRKYIFCTTTRLYNKLNDLRTSHQLSTDDVPAEMRQNIMIYQRDYCFCLLSMHFVSHVVYVV